MAVTKAQVAQLYVALFNRAPEGAGLNAWVSAGVFRDQAQTADAMLQSPAIAAYFNGRIDTNRGYVENIYKNILGKDYSQDPDGINAWVRHLELGHTRGETLVTLFQVARSPEAIAADPTAAAVFANKTAIAAYMAEKITDIESDGSGNFNYAPFQQIIETTNSTNLEEQKAKIDQLADAAKPGSKIFTTGVDTLKGTEGDDTFSAVYYSGNGDKTSTLSSLDTLDGLGGKDTLKVTVLKNGAQSELDLGDLDNAMRGVTNIENLEIRSEVTIKAPVAPALMSKLNKGLDNLSITSPGDIKLETDTKEKVTIDTNKIATLTADKAKEISVKGGDDSAISAKEATKASINLGTNTKVLTVGANGLDKVEDLSLANLKLAAALTATKLVKISVKDVDFNGAQIATNEEKVDLTTNYTEKGTAKLQADNATQLTIHANGEKESTIEFVSASPNHNKLEKVTFDGNAKDLKINLQQETVLKDVNAASFTGNFAELKVKNIAGSQVLLGSGNDVVDIDNTNAEQTINGGAGTDLISISTTIAGAGADKVTLKNFEGIRINNTIGNDIDMSKWEGFNNITLAMGSGAHKLEKVLNNSTITVEKNLLGSDLTVEVKDAANGTSDKLNLVFNPKGTAAGLANTGNFVIDDIENIDIASNLDDNKTATATNTVNLKASAADKGTLTNVVIKGDAKTKLVLDGALKKLKTVDASTLKGDFKFDASGHLDEKSVIKGGAGDDEITFGSKSGATVTGGAGDDTFILGTVGDSAAFPASKTATITDFSKGDKLKIGANLTSSPSDTIDQNIARYDSTKSLDFANNLSRALDVAKAASNKLAYFTYTDPDSNATDTYLVRSDATAGLSASDYVVKLTGIVDLANATLADAGTNLQLTL